MPEAIPLLSLEGRRGERGFAYGRCMSTPIHDNVVSYVRRFRDVAGLDRGSVFRWGAHSQRVIAERLAVTVDDLAGVFRDHYSHPNAICRHVDERDARPERACSVWSIVMDLTERRFGIAAHPPCEHEYEWLSLPVAAGAAAPVAGE